MVSFVAHLFQSGYAYSSITSSLSAISYVHKLHQIADPTANFVVKKLLQGASRLRPSIDVRAPVTKSILHSLVRSTSAVTNCFFASTLLSSMYLQAFHAFLRIGEIVVTSASKIDTVLQIHQISIEENKCTIVFYAYKHYKGQPVTLVIYASDGSDFCPVKHIKHYLVLRGTSPGPHFLYFRGAHRLLENFVTVIYQSHCFGQGCLLPFTKVTVSVLVRPLQLPLWGCPMNKYNVWVDGNRTR